MSVDQVRGRHDPAGHPVSRTRAAALKRFPPMAAKTLKQISRGIRSRAKSILKYAARFALKPTGFTIVRESRLIDYYLHEYESYEHYKSVQVFHNKRKLQNVWADRTTLALICDELVNEFPGQRLRGLCHGSRNGFEQRFMNEYAGFEVLGTDISETAREFENTVQWDFHDVNDQWVATFDFIYSNSLDQAWNPRAALVTWLNQLKSTGLLIIEHTEAHGPTGASEMDPFGVRPKVMPYILSEWFGWNISIRVLKSVKDNTGMDVWIYFVKKNVPDIG